MGEKFNVKRFLITLVVVLVAIGATAGPMWYYMNDAIQTNKDTIASLKSQVDKLSESMKDSAESDDSSDDAEEAAYEDVTAAEAKDLIDDEEDLVVLDVSNAYDAGHIPGAINYYVSDGSLDDAIEDGTLDSEDTYLVYCHVDSASISGAQKLIEAGFENVYRLEGNYSAWTAAGYDVEE